jgi:predicted alpha-1,6-mannanase (GH76 family)
VIVWDTPTSVRLWADRADLAEQAVRTRHLRRLWGIPGTLLGVGGWPATVGQRLFGPWNYWWQAHLLDCLVDAYTRSPSPRRLAAIRRLVCGVRVRNGFIWRNDYYDDMAWLALALLRAEREAGVSRPGAVPALAAALRSGWTDHGGGGIWWRRRDKYREVFKNAPTNGPAAILFARLANEPDSGGDDRNSARALAGWMERNLIDPRRGLVYDGLRTDDDGGVESIEHAIYTYCQGVFIGACIELATISTGTEAIAWIRRAERTITAVVEHLAVPGRLGPVLRGQGGRDGGLFAGILARYLALAAPVLAERGARHEPAGRLAADLVYSSADEAWRNRTVAPGGPVFGAEWAAPAPGPRRGGGPECDLSVQAGAWMLLEAAARLERSGFGPAW